MGAVRVLFGMFCLAGVCSSGVFSGGTVGDGTGNREIATRRSAPRNDAKRVIEIARREIGVMEKGCQNCGAAVEGYLDYVGIKTPAPWCAAWVSWVYGQAGYGEPRTAWSPALFPKERVVNLDPSHARDDKTGLVFGIYFPHLKRIGHCGIVERLQGDFVVSIEGNTNMNGGREGDGVYRKLRHKRTIAKYADWIRPVPP